uniref:Type II secretion system core protein G n=1 Tax=Candidatus Kentrum sp. SD TaxID=2126332 RepID=A0A450YAP4_9GAMM|nr:MAG: general secretion pathway protein G [Candidatus Kentron sp. SD]
MRLNSGFTLIEVMVVVVILGILAAIVVPKVMDRPDMARVTKAEQDIRALESALSLYRLDNFRYPSTDEGLGVLISGRTKNGDRKSSGYLSRVPKDPWGNEYLYLQPGQHSEIDVYTLGADGRPGGKGFDTDIGNWDL